MFGLSGAAGSATELQVGAEMLVAERWLFRLTAAGTGMRDQQLDQQQVAGGHVAWRRLLLLPTAGAAWRRRDLFLDAGVGLAAVIVRARGVGFATNSEDSTFDLGAAPTLRLGTRIGRLPVAVWVAGAAFFWVRRHQLAAEGPSSAAPEVPGVPEPLLALPRWDVSFTGGLTFFLRS